MSTALLHVALLVAARVGGWYSNAGPLFDLVGPPAEIPEDSTQRLQSVLAADPRLLTDAGAFDDSNHWLLNMAAYYGNYPATRVLLRAGADVLIPSEYGKVGGGVK